jgi:hypothetical protein
MRKESSALICRACQLPFWWRTLPKGSNNGTTESYSSHPLPATTRRRRRGGTGGAGRLADRVAAGALAWTGGWNVCRILAPLKSLPMLLAVFVIRFTNQRHTLIECVIAIVRTKDRP